MTTGGASPTVSSLPAAVTAVPDDMIERPLVDVEGCVPYQAWEIEFAQPLYGRASSEPIALQVLAAHGSVEAPFVIAQRYFSDARTDPTAFGSIVDINGVPAAVLVDESGLGHAQWLLSDGSGAYLRSSGLTAAELADVARSLVPRDRSEAVPGFDLESAPFDLTILDETVEPVTGHVAGSACRTDEATISVALLQGDQTFMYSAALDAPELPSLSRLASGDLIGITGATDDHPATRSDIVNADQDDWDALLSTSQHLPP